MSESLWDDARITAYVLDELPDDQRGAFESELKSNAELAAAVDEARRVTGQLEAFYAAEPAATLDSDRRASIVPDNPAIPGDGPISGDVRESGDVRASGDGS